jgi:oligosaccharide repeat unit polymerase
MFILYYSLFGASLIYSIKKYRNIINPISIFSIFLFLLSFSFIRLAKNQTDYSLCTYFVLNLSIFSYFLGVNINLNFRPIKLPKINNKLRKIFLYGFSIFSFLTCILECIRFGFIPIFQLSSIDIYNETNGKLIPFLHYFITLAGFLPTWSYVLFKNKILSKKELFFFLILSLLILINYLSRQLYLMAGFSLFIAYSYYNIVNYKKIILSGLVIISLFFTVGFLRFNNDSPVSFSEFSRAAAGIESEDVNFIESIIVEYSSKRFSVLNDLVVYSNSLNYFGFGIYTFRPILSFFLLEKKGIINRNENLDTEKLVATYTIDPYLDFNFFGVVFLNILYGFLAIRYYKQFHNKYDEAIIKFSIIFFCIIMGVFVNYFNSMLVWLGLLFNKILTGGISKYNTINK